MDTKDKIMKSAVELFQNQGYHGTSVRMIASKANVNVSLVSYYFGGKKGLLETLIIEFFEGYVKRLEDAMKSHQHDGCLKCLHKMMQTSLYYQQENVYLSRFVQREITLDTMLVREIMTTYLMKEKHLFYQVLKKGMDNNEIKKQPIDFIIIQIRSLLTMPYLQPQYIREVHHLFVQDHYFLNEYVKYIQQWIENCLIFKKHKQPLSLRSR